MDVVIDRELDLEDLYSLPDDGNRYEILDGAVVMTPPPNTAHQNVAAELTAILRDATRGRRLKVFFAPFAWRIGPGQVPEPDLVVAPPEAFTARALERPPLLVVEILSPSGRGRDLFEKRRIYAEGRAAWYWIADPVQPSLTVLRLAGAAYEDQAHVIADEVYEAREPFPVRVVPSALTF
ncbi:MAG: Uma2 family endonuclease [Candidatus Dormibacteraeota bacterium]|nr:Uma2 family endonuclease [Candidatus Dormibacteraeota bacterium]